MAKKVYEETRYQILESGERMVPVPLTEEELTEERAELARLEAVALRREAEDSLTIREIRERAKERRSEIALLARVIEAGTDDQSRDVVIELDRVDKIVLICDAMVASKKGMAAARNAPYQTRPATQDELEQLGLTFGGTS